MSNLIFDAEAHVYTVNGKVLPSVTEILSKLGFIDTKWFTEESRERGTVVHKICEMYDIGTLDEESVDPRLSGYLEAWKDFSIKMEFVWTHIEHKMASRLFAGTCDRVGIDRKGKTFLLDIKTGKYPSMWIGWQLAAYRTLLEAEGIRIDEQASVHLSEDGTFDLQLWEHVPEDWKAIVRTYHLREKKR
ncbi:MAG: PD-(D/E)XK nuclease family protein [Leptospirales bacterium]